MSITKMALEMALEFAQDALQYNLESIAKVESDPNEDAPLFNPYCEESESILALMAQVEEELEKHTD